MRNQITSLGAAEIARQIREGQIAPLEVVDAYIVQIEKVNPAINALVTPTFDEARREARLAGERLAGKPAELPPLFGVPVTIKDALPVAGVRFTAGSSYRKDHVATEDAAAVRRLRQAGAIILGKTNCADMSGSTETHNLVFGLTRNPWNPAHSAGGSSGGEAALIAAGGSPLGLGSDIAGSIRIPAAFCGIVGLKPTAGRIPTDGHYPPTPEAISGWNTIGPLARRVEDLALALSVLSNAPVADYRKIDLGNHQVLVPPGLQAMPIGPDIAAAVQDAAGALSRSGMKVISKARLPLPDVTYEYSAIMHRDWLPQYRLLLGNGKAVRTISELIANATGKGRVSPATLSLLVTMGLAGPPLRLWGYGHIGQLDRLRLQILDQMGPGGLILWPAFPTTAPRHGFAWRMDRSPAYTGVFNSLSFPSVVVPVGLSRGRLPRAVQIIGRPDEDETVLAAAAVLEREFGGCPIAPAS